MSHPVCTRVTRKVFSCDCRHSLKSISVTQRIGSCMNTIQTPPWRSVLTDYIMTALEVWHSWRYHGSEARALSSDDFLRFSLRSRCSPVFWTFDRSLPRLCTFFSDHQLLVSWISSWSRLAWRRLTTRTTRGCGDGWNGRSCEDIDHKRSALHLRRDPKNLERVFSIGPQNSPWETRSAEADKSLDPTPAERWTKASPSRLVPWHVAEIWKWHFSCCFQHHHGWWDLDLQLRAWDKAAVAGLGLPWRRMSNEGGSWTKHEEEDGGHFRSTLRTCGYNRPRGSTHGNCWVVHRHLLTRCLRKASRTASKNRAFWTVSPPRQCELPHRPSNIDLLGATVNACSPTSTVFAGSGPMWLFCVSESEVRTSWKAFWHTWRRCWCLPWCSRWCHAFRVV